MLAGLQDRLLDRPLDRRVGVAAQPGCRRSARKNAHPASVGRRPVGGEGGEDLAGFDVDEPDVELDFRLLDAAAPLQKDQRRC